MLLVRSLGTGAWVWRDEIEYWKTRFDVVAFDARGPWILDASWRGFGRSHSRGFARRGSLAGFRDGECGWDLHGGPICVHSRLSANSNPRFEGFGSYSRETA
jgi:hypothetical protein